MNPAGNIAAPLTPESSVGVDAPQSEERPSDIDRLLETAGVSAVVIDRQERIMRSTSQFVQMFGIADFIGKRLSDVLAVQTLGTATPSPVVPGASGAWEQRRIETADGRWFSRRTIPVLDNDGQYAYAVVSFLPLERSMVLGERLQLLAGSYHLVWWWDWDFDTGTISFDRDDANPLGYGADTLPRTGPAFFGLMHPDELPAIQAGVEDCMAGRRNGWSVEHRVQTISGSWRWVLTTGKLVEPDSLGRARRMAGITIDVHARRTAEDAVRRQTDVLAQLQEAVVCIGADGRVAFWNQSATGLFGWPADQMIGQQYVNRLPDANAREELESLIARARAGEVIRGERVEWSRDRKIWVEFSLGPYADADGNVAGAVDILRLHAFAPGGAPDGNGAVLSEPPRGGPVSVKSPHNV